MINLLLFVQFLVVSHCLTGKLTPQEDKDRAASCGLQSQSQLLNAFIEFRPNGPADILAAISPRHVIASVGLLNYEYNATICKQKKKDISDFLFFKAKKATLIGGCDKTGFLLLEVKNSAIADKAVFCLPTSKTVVGDSVEVIVKSRRMAFDNETQSVIACKKAHPKKFCTSYGVPEAKGPVAAWIDGRLTIVGGLADFPNGMWSYYAFKAEICAESGVCMDPIAPPTTSPPPTTPKPTTLEPTTTKPVIIVPPNSSPPPPSVNPPSVTSSSTAASGSVTVSSVAPSAPPTPSAPSASAAPPASSTLPTPSTPSTPSTPAPGSPNPSVATPAQQPGSQAVTSKTGIVVDPSKPSTTHDSCEDEYLCWGIDIFKSASNINALIILFSALILIFL